MRFAVRRVLAAVVVILVISYIALLMQFLAYATQARETTSPREVVAQVAVDTVQFWRNLARGDVGQHSVRFGFGWRGDADIGPKIPTWFGNSFVLLLFSMLSGAVLGSLIGFAAAIIRRPGASLGLILLSIVGISTPSFFLGMLLQSLEVAWYKATGIRLLPVGGYGWDSHLVLPVLVLAARPIAQVARLAYIQVNEILGEDYVRTGHAKGLAPWALWRRHVLPNAAATILTAAGTSLRFSLSSLPVVEVIFGWPGAGRALLDLMRSNAFAGATALVIVMGGSFVIINTLVDIAYYLIDPRLRRSGLTLAHEAGWSQWVGGLLRSFWEALTLATWRQRHQRRQEAGQLASLQGYAVEELDPELAQAQDLAKRAARRLAWRRALGRNPSLWIGVLIAAALLLCFTLGPQLAPHDATALQALVEVDGQVVRPPVPPSEVYPLGTDGQGRDILSLILTGARRTLTIAALAVAARLLVGGVLGFVAGWFSNSLLDRAIVGLAEVLDAFPALLLAMLAIYAVGVREGIRAFAIGLALIGWGEVMLTVRGQVQRIRPTAYIEGAIATGATEGRILSAHVLPNVWPTMVSLVFLEMGGVLMVLGELGFLEVFIGGGIATQGNFTPMPTVWYYDVPEWSVMLANSWKGFRSYPWATLYPALAFFVAILGFNSLGEGLRELTERLTLSMRSFFNRYTLLAALVVLLGGRWMLQQASLYGQYEAAARAFDGASALEDVRYLASAELAGRLSGSPQGELTAEWIAARFADLGLRPAGVNNTFFQTVSGDYRDLAGVPRLTITSPQGERIEATFGTDFCLANSKFDITGSSSGELVAVGENMPFIWSRDRVAECYGLTLQEIADPRRIILSLNAAAAIDEATYVAYNGRLFLAQDPIAERPYQLLSAVTRFESGPSPSVEISPELFARLLEPLGETVESYLARNAALGAQQCLFLPTGWQVELDLSPITTERQPVRNVVGFWPGVDIGLDSDAVFVSAYYDGLGTATNGTLYPSANANASGVAVLLELIATLKESEYLPARSLFFVAWVGGERGTPVDYSLYLQAADYFAEAYTVVAAMDLAGVGAGSGKTAVGLHDTSTRLVEVVREAARTVNTPFSLRAQGLHSDPERWPEGDPDEPSITLSWAGADDSAHTTDDMAESLDPDKLIQSGRLVTLATMVLGRDTSY